MRLIAYSLLLLMPLITNANVIVGDRDVVAATLYLEARGEGLKGMEMVADVIRNRAIASGKSMSDECLKPYQFSCWNGSNAFTRYTTIAKVKKSPLIVDITHLIGRVEEGSDDITGGATSYCTINCHPKWRNSMKETVRYKNHVFFSK